MKLKEVKSYDEFEVGQRVVLNYLPHYARDVTIGTVYTIIGQDTDGDFYFLDDVGDKNFSIGVDYWGHYDPCIVIEDVAEYPVEDKGKHYRHSFRLNITDEDIKNGYVTVNLDPYRVSDTYGLGGWREHIVKKTLRGTDKGHSVEELIEELQCCLDRAKQMYNESKEIV